eukprot:1123972-Pleurochrysis_carterae.AAC.1
MLLYSRAARLRRWRSERRGRVGSACLARGGGAACSSSTHCGRRKGGPCAPSEQSKSEHRYFGRGARIEAGSLSCGQQHRAPTEGAEALDFESRRDRFREQRRGQPGKEPAVAGCDAAACRDPAPAVFDTSAACFSQRSGLRLSGFLPP